MSRNGFAFGLAGLMVLSPVVVAHAQEIANQAPATQAAAPACSGLLCIFGGGETRAAQPQTPTAAQQAEAQAASQADHLDVDAASNALDRKLARERREKARVAQQAKVAQAKAAQAKAAQVKVAQPGIAKAKAPPLVHAVTIAADTAELGRLKTLAKAMPKEHIKLVRAEDARATSADLTVTAKLDPAQAETGPKLFVEQLHIVAGARIKSVADLEGKAVSFGPDSGASQAAARKAFAALAVGVKETPLEVDNALDGVATGDLAAVVLLAPQPAEQLKRVAGLHLVAWPENGAVPSGAVVATIDGSAYPGLAKPGDKIRAIGVDAVLSINPGGTGQATTRPFMDALAQHAASLSRRGFDLIKADTDANSGRRFAGGERH